MNNYALFTQALLNYPITEIAEKLSLHIGTLARWKQQSKVPASYKKDLLRILGVREELQGDFCLVPYATVLNAIPNVLLFALIV